MVHVIFNSSCDFTRKKKRNDELVVVHQIHDSLHHWSCSFHHAGILPHISPNESQINVDSSNNTKVHPFSSLFTFYLVINSYLSSSSSTIGHPTTNQQTPQQPPTLLSPPQNSIGIFPFSTSGVELAQIIDVESPILIF